MSEATTPQAEAAPPDRAQLNAILKRSMGSFAALSEGIRLAGRTAGIGGGTALLYALVGSLVGWPIIEFGNGMLEMDAAAASLGAQVSGSVAVCLLLSLAIQVTKRETASRASWAPGLLAIPAALITAAFAMVSSGSAGGMQPFIPALCQIAWVLVWASFGGAAAAIVWVRSGNAALQGETIAAGELISEVQRRTLEISAPHGARVQIVSIGFQVVLPGIFYALQYAFVDMVAVLDPERSALRRSGQLTWGMRGRLFRMFLIYWFVTGIASLGIAMAIDGGSFSQRFTEMLMNPTGFTLPVLVAQETLWALGTWVLTLALLALYQEREGQVRAKRALRALDRAEAEAAVSEGAASDA